MTWCTAHLWSLSWATWITVRFCHQPGDCSYCRPCCSSDPVRFQTTCSVLATHHAMPSPLSEGQLKSL